MNKLLSIIIIGSDTVDVLINVIESAWSIGPHEIIVVINKSKENEVSKRLAEKLGCKVIIIEQTDGNKGYTQAAKKAKGDVLLFLRGDNVLQPSQLNTFLQPILDDHVEVVLNNLDPLFFERRAGQWPDSYTVWKQVLNDALGHMKQNINSLLSMPHALTKEVIEAIGYESLKNPVLAHMRILEQGWNISSDCYIEPTPGEFLSAEQSYYKVELTDDEKQNKENYLKTLGEWHRVHGVRGSYHDGGRRRDIIEQIKKHKPSADDPGKAIIKSTITKGWGLNSSIYNGKQLSVIIPAQNEEGTIEKVIQEARKIEPQEIIVVVNGSTDNTEKIAKQCGATVIVYEEALGHDVGRAIGAQASTGDILLFIDADFPIADEDLLPFSQAISNGVDVALNDLNNLNLLTNSPFYVVDIYKYMLNLACNRKDLGIGSLVAVPHAISRTCLDGIGWDVLLNPCLAHAKVILEGYNVSCVHFVDVIKPNRIRPDQHYASEGHPQAVLRINGDHLEAIAYLIKKLESDGNFHRKKKEACLID